MTLLFDENLSPRLVGLLSDLYPGSVHARDVGLFGRPDAEVWEVAARDGHTIVSKNGDFFQRSILFGPPPKVVWLRIGNGPTRDAEALLHARVTTIHTFTGDPSAALIRLPD